MSRQTTLTYTSGNLTRVTVPGNSGNVHADFTYDASNRLYTCTDAAGYTYTYGYDASNRVTSLTDPSGREIDYTYDGSGGSAPSAPTGWPVPSRPTPIPPTEQRTALRGSDRNQEQRQPRHPWVYENTDDPNNGRYIRRLARHRRGRRRLPPTSTSPSGTPTTPSIARPAIRDSYQPETGGKAHRHFYYYTDNNNPTKVTKYIDPENSDANPSDTGLPTGNCPGYTYTYDSQRQQVDRDHARRAGDGLRLLLRYQPALYHNRQGSGRKRQRGKSRHYLHLLRFHQGLSGPYRDGWLIATSPPTTTPPPPATSPPSPRRRERHHLHLQRHG